MPSLIGDGTTSMKIFQLENLGAEKVWKNCRITTEN